MADKETDQKESISPTVISQSMLGKEDISKIALEVVTLLQASAEKNPATTMSVMGEDTSEGSSKGKEPAEGELHVHILLVDEHKHTGAR